MVTALAMLSLLTVAAFSQTRDSCLDCHANLPDPLGVTAERFSQDVHAQAGLTCADCHGGDPTSDDPERAMNRAAGWKGKIEHRQVPQLCASCHSDADRMRKYDPNLRVDQFQEYKTSVHGKRWAAGDEKVAVCTDCHGVHDLRGPKDPRSNVHPANVAATCARCHADVDYMKPYGIPTNQFASYKQSVHFVAMTVRGDLSAPTCTTCHGNHGATPPGVDNVTNVCATCHVFQAQLFAKSPHETAFARAGLPTCVMCHSDHKIDKTSDDMLGAGPKAVCTNCHVSGDAGYQAAVSMRTQIDHLSKALDAADEILQRAERSGMEVSQAKLQQTQARDALLKARVTVHTSNPKELMQDVQPGLDVAAKTYAAGQQALVERRYRRFGLGVSVVTILIVLIGLRLYIREIEKK